jgi:hypothetical protein
VDPTQFDPGNSPRAVAVIFSDNSFTRIRISVRVIPIGEIEGGARAGSWPVSASHAFWTFLMEAGEEEKKIFIFSVITH